MVSTLKFTSALQSTWRRYLNWRRAEGYVTPRAADDKVPNKVAADEGDIIRHKFSNRGGGWGTNG